MGELTAAPPLFVVVVWWLLLLVITVFTSVFRDPLDVAMDVLLAAAFTEDELMAVELRTLTEVLVLFALDGGGG